ncbi:hypothetical protein [Candidatus Nanohalovita haloferacivicina]|uniref:hypothetical protein n=1 Tax=Candidatus Nanohalovita haloferacivicina TaxID=2978046 RepID=UPI00325F97F1|nr:hypothetical protein HBNXNv_0828 [Candidatus Nanohalobia archaeon BNXNv]
MDAGDIEKRILSNQNEGLEGKNKKPVSILLRLLNQMQELQKVQQEFPEEFNDHHKHIFLHYTSSVINLEEGYINTKYCNYKSFKRTLRYLYESYLVLEGLNEDRAESKDMMKEWKQEVKELNEEGLSTEDRMKEELSIVDKLHKIRGNKKGEMKKKNKRYGDFYNLSSNYASHPVRLGASMSDRTPDEDKELNQVVHLIWLGYGTIQKLENAFEGTDVKEYIEEETGGIKKEIEDLGKTPEFIDG